MPGEDLHLSMLVRSQAHLNRFAVGEEDACVGRGARHAAPLSCESPPAVAKTSHLL